jgi:hypothetical protein
MRRRSNERVLWCYGPGGSSPECTVHPPEGRLRPQPCPRMARTTQSAYDLCGWCDGCVWVCLVREEAQWGWWAEQSLTALCPSTPLHLGREGRESVLQFVKLFVYATRVCHLHIHAHAVRLGLCFARAGLCAIYMPPFALGTRKEERPCCRH